MSDSTHVFERFVYFALGALSLWAYQQLMAQSAGPGLKLGSNGDGPLKQVPMLSAAEAAERALREMGL